MAASASCTWPQAMISIRSASDSSGEYSRIGAATTLSRSRARLSDHRMRHAVQMLDLFGQDGAHLDRRIARQTFQGLDGQGDDMVAFALLQARHQAGDLDRQFGAHVLFVVVGQHAVGGGRRRRIGGNRLAHGGRAMLGQILQHRFVDIGMLRQIGLNLVGADFQDVQRIARVEPRRRAPFWGLSMRLSRAGSVVPAAFKDL